MRLLRRLLTCLTVAAYLCAASFAPMVYASAPPKAMSGMQHEHGGDCCDPGSRDTSGKPGCLTEIGCVFLISVVSPSLTLSTSAAWSSVRYDHQADTLRGRSIAPALGPPISLA